jgi:hypothetical protein
MLGRLPYNADDDDDANVNVGGGGGGGGSGGDGGRFNITATRAAPSNTAAAVVEAALSWEERTLLKASRFPHPVLVQSCVTDRKPLIFIGTYTANTTIFPYVFYFFIGTYTLHWYVHCEHNARVLPFRIAR